MFFIIAILKSVILIKSNKYIFMMKQLKFGFIQLGNMITEIVIPI